MAFKNLIRNQVNNAFNLIQDLAEDITFINSTVTTDNYNFSTDGGFTEPTAADSITIKGVISQMSKDVNDNTIVNAQVTLNTNNSIEFDNYDTISFRNKTWSVTSVEDNGFVVILNATRKV